MAEEDISNLIRIISRNFGSETARVRFYVGKEVVKEIEDRAQDPANVIDAFVLDSAHSHARNDDVWEFFLEKNIGYLDQDNVWHGDSTTQIVDRIVNFINEDGEHITNEAKKWQGVIERAEACLDTDDETNIQMFVIKDKDLDNWLTSTYAYLVYYPPVKTGDAKVRKVEISFPTAMCHTVDAVVLLDEHFLPRFTGLTGIHQQKNELLEAESQGHQFKMRRFKIKPISDEELENGIEQRGTTWVDRLIQWGLATKDKLSKKKGEHVDAIRALVDQDWALKYALACHRQVGLVTNHRIFLPSQKNK